MGRFGFIFDSSLCRGCNACQVACKDYKNLPVGFYFRRADTIKAEGKDAWLHVTAACNHCTDAPCVKVCNAKGLLVEADGTISHRSAMCVACGRCAAACPYQAIYIDHDKKTARKCNGCKELRDMGKAPACVEACPNHALSYGDLDAFLMGLSEEERGAYTDHVSFLSHKEAKPNLLVKVKKDMTFSETVPVNVKLSNKTEKKTAIAPLKKTETEKVGEKLLEAVSFFRGRECALSVMTSFDDFGNHTEKMWKDAYDMLFRGTDPFVTLPLYASCKDGGRVLLNEITLKVIHTYHDLGYEPVEMDHMPPDYLGQMLSFLVYLAAAFEKEDQRGKSLIQRSIKSFTEEEILPTLLTLTQSLRGLKDVYKGFDTYLTKMYAILSDQKLYMKLTRKDSGIASLTTGLHAPIENEKQVVINTAGVGNCGGICVIRPTVADGCLLRIESDCNPEHDPQIRACVRGRGYRATFLNMERLKYPMKRVGERGSGKFERISWEEALLMIHSEWVRIRDSYGPGSRYVQYSTGVEGIIRGSRLIERLLDLDGGHLGFFNSYSSACVNYISNYVYGSPISGGSPQDFLNSKLLILWADNSAESIFGPERNHYITEAKKKGIKIIAIDPRCSQTAIAYADQWIPIKPATDAALCDALAYVILSENLQDQAFMDRYCLGFDEEHMPEGLPYGLSYKSYLFGLKDGVEKTPAWASNITGIKEETIIALAREIAMTKPVCISAGLGAQRNANGEQQARGIMMLCALTGNIGIPGGSAGGNASMFHEHEGISLFHDMAENPYPGKIPVFLWTKAIEKWQEMTPHRDRLKGVNKLSSGIKMLFNLASDILINQHSDINDTIRILKDTSLCEFIVCSDIFMTPSARYADLVLPATSVFESENMVNPWAGGNYVLKNNQVIPPLFECRNEFDWIVELSRLLGLYEAFTEGKERAEDWIRDSYAVLRKKEEELPDYDSFSFMGGYQYKKPYRYIAFEDEIKDPEKHPFKTPSGRIEIFSKALYELSMESGDEEILAIPGYLPGKDSVGDKRMEVYPLLLVGWHTRRRCHSVHDNNPWEEEVDRPLLWIHTEDARERGIVNGQQVEVFNDHGRVRIEAFVTERIMKGVIAMAQGAWYSPDQKKVDRRGSINVLTSAAHPTPIAKGNPQHSNLAQVILVSQEDS